MKKEKQCRTLLITLNSAKVIEVMEAKTPEDIYKVLNVSFHVIDLTLDAYFKICCCDDIPS